MMQFVKEGDVMIENIDKTINAICEFIQDDFKYCKEGGIRPNTITVEMTKALADLIEARTDVNEILKL